MGTLFPPGCHIFVWYLIYIECSISGVVFVLNADILAYSSTKCKSGPFGTGLYSPYLVVHQLHKGSILEKIYDIKSAYVNF